MLASCHRRICSRHRAGGHCHPVRKREGYAFKVSSTQATIMRGAPRLGAQLPARARARFTRLRTRIQLRIMVLPKHINAFVPLYYDDFKIRITTYPNSTREQLRSDCDSLKNQRGGRRTKPRTVAEHMKDWFLALEIGIDIDRQLCSCVTTDKVTITIGYVLVSLC